eukprot:COSAG01_NODE_4792_length_4740_cov_8.902392_6_plen_120_part_00
MQWLNVVGVIDHHEDAGLHAHLPTELSDTMSRGEVATSHTLPYPKRITTTISCATLVTEELLLQPGRLLPAQASLQQLRKVRESLGRLHLPQEVGPPTIVLGAGADAVGCDTAGQPRSV